jgi:hypothetical protein
VIAIERERGSESQPFPDEELAHDKRASRAVPSDAAARGSSGSNEVTAADWVEREIAAAAAKWSETHNRRQLRRALLALCQMLDDDAR